jgi:hypothetical protein
VPPHVPLVASEHNQMSWPSGDHRAGPGRSTPGRHVVLPWAGGVRLGGRARPRRPAAGRALGSAGLVGPAVAGIALAAGDLHRPVPRRQGTRRAGGGARPPRRARACLPRRRRPHAPSAGPAGPGPRAADRGAPPRLVLQAVPPCDGASARVAPSREESWSQSAVVATRPWRLGRWHRRRRPGTPWATAAASSSHPTTRTLLRRRCLASWPAAAGIRRRALRHLRPAAAGPR